MSKKVNYTNEMGFKVVEMKETPCRILQKRLRSKTQTPTKSLVLMDQFIDFIKLLESSMPFETE